MEAMTMPEMVHQVNDTKFRYNIGDELAARVLGLIQVHVYIPHQDGFLDPEALRGILKTREVGQRGWCYVCSNDQGMGLRDPYHQPSLQDQAPASLRYAGTGRPGFQ